MVSSAYFENKNINYLQATHFSFHGTTDAELGADEMDISSRKLPRAGIVVVHRKIQTLLDGALSGCGIKHLINKYVQVFDVA